MRSALQARSFARLENTVNDLGKDKTSLSYRLKAYYPASPRRQAVSVVNLTVKL
jgi:hypothetical protein